MIELILLSENLQEIRSVLWPIVSDKYMRDIVTSKMLFSGLNSSHGLCSWLVINLVIVTVMVDCDKVRSPIQFEEVL